MTKEEAIKLVSADDVFALENLSNEFKNDKEIVLAAVSNYGGSLQYASDELKNDKDIVLAAVSKNGASLEDASDELKKDKEIVLAAVSNYGCSLYYACDELKNDKEIVLAAVSNGGSLEDASDELKKDKEIVLAAVSKSGRSLKYASDELKKDKEIVLAAVSDYGGSLQYASDELNGDLEIILAALDQNSSYVDSIRSEVILKEIALNSSVGKKKINFKVRDLARGVENLFKKRLLDENGDLKDEFESICKEWFDFNQIIYQNQKMNGDALLSLAQVQFAKYRPLPTDGRNVEEYTRDLLVQAIELNDEALDDIIMYGLSPEEYLDFSDLAEKACELSWNGSDKSYSYALSVIGTDRDEIEVRDGLSEEFAKKVIKEAREVDTGEEDDKENFENFVSETGLE